MTEHQQSLADLASIANRHITELEKELSLEPLELTVSDREKSVRSLKILLNVIQDIAEMENHLENADEKNQIREIDEAQRLELAKRIKALRDRS